MTDELLASARSHIEFEGLRPDGLMGQLIAEVERLRDLAHVLAVAAWAVEKEWIIRGDGRCSTSLQVALQDASARYRREEL